ncbi:hypothetical protein B0T20DRAFT_468710 [Sordaria brevicollis]|uniref:Uncharacterized protein n=1 Tax=Sordaria brevicollis TaxID=83679 RepID=A0AAE0UD05_SORBR|nr:hypothetical protein B0T20DRAFT_468710 [Sordaria brevicollis]
MVHDLEASCRPVTVPVLRHLPDAVSWISTNHLPDAAVLAHTAAVSSKLARRDGQSNLAPVTPVPHELVGIFTQQQVRTLSQIYPSSGVQTGHNWRPEISTWPSYSRFESLFSGQWLAWPSKLGPARGLRADKLGSCYTGAYGAFTPSFIKQVAIVLPCGKKTTSRTYEKSSWGLQAERRDTSTLVSDDPGSELLKEKAWKFVSGLNPASKVVSMWNYSLKTRQLAVRIRQDSGTLCPDVRIKLHATTMPSPRQAQRLPGSQALSLGQKNGRRKIIDGDRQWAVHALGPFRYGTDSNTPMLLDATVASHKCQPLMKPCKLWLSLSWKWWWWW